MSDNFPRWGFAPYEAEEWTIRSDKSRSEIIEEARSQYGETFVIGRFGPPELSQFRIDAAALIESALEGCGPAGESVAAEIGEDGEHGLDNLPDLALAELQELLTAACRHWVERHEVRSYYLSGPTEIEHFNSEEARSDG
ncbi:MAG: hypothetical protein IE925_10085 [Rhodobacterales bacterium]|nr:hypothetical protein [Rhodobacterales bacterium]